MVPLAPTHPYGGTIYEGDALDEEKYEMGHPNEAAQKEAVTSQVGRDGRPRIQKGDVPHDEMSAFFEEVRTTLFCFTRVNRLTRSFVNRSRRCSRICVARTA